MLDLEIEEQESKYDINSSDDGRMICVRCFFRTYYASFAMSTDFTICSICKKTRCSIHNNCCYACSFKLLKCYSCGDKISNYNYELFKLDKYVTEYLNDLKQRMDKASKDDKEWFEDKINVANKAFCQLIEFFWKNTKIINTVTLTLTNLEELVNNTIFVKEEIEDHIKEIRASKTNKLKNYAQNTGYGLGYLVATYDFFIL